MARYNAKLLEQQKEYIGVLGRFVSGSSLAKEFGVCVSTIGNFKREVGVEYIRNYKNRLYAAVEAYQTNPDSYIKNQIAELVLSPVAKEIAKDMNQEVTLIPVDGYFRLYAAVFGEGIETKKEIKEEELGIMVDELIKYIPTGQFTNRYSLGNSLVEKLSQEFYKPLPPDLKERFNGILATLDERERKVLAYRFGLYDGMPSTLEEVGAALNVSRERARQIGAKALRELRCTTQSKEMKELGATCLRYLNYLKAPEEGCQKKKSVEDELGLWESQIDRWASSDDLREELRYVINVHRQKLENYYLPSCIEKSLSYSLLVRLFKYVGLLETKIDALCKGETAKIEPMEPERAELEKRLSMPTYGLKLSVRSSNCLKDAAIKTVRDLVQKTEKEMSEYRNFGKKSLAEVEEVLAEMGLSLGMKI